MDQINKVKLAFAGKQRTNNSKEIFQREEESNEKNITKFLGIFLIYLPRAKKRRKNESKVLRVSCMNSADNFGQ